MRRIEKFSSIVALSFSFLLLLCTLSYILYCLALQDAMLELKFCNVWPMLYLHLEVSCSSLGVVRNSPC